MRVIQHLCFVEIKELAETPADVAMMHELLSGKPSLRWINPGVRLRQSIKDSAAQLRKFSYRGFPTVVCFFDTTAGFHLERVHVTQAMFGRATLHFEVSSDPAHEPRYLGMWHGKRATLTSRNNTSISAVAVLRQPDAPDWLHDRPWIQGHRNQQGLLDAFFSAIEPKESLVFFYAKRTPLLDDDQWIIVGAAKVTSIGDLREWDYESGATSPIRSYLWERSVCHSLRPDGSGEGLKVVSLPLDFLDQPRTAPQLDKASRFYGRPSSTLHYFNPTNTIVAPPLP